MKNKQMSFIYIGFPCIGKTSVVKNLNANIPFFKKILSFIKKDKEKYYYNYDYDETVYEDIVYRGFSRVTLSNTVYYFDRIFVSPLKEVLNASKDLISFVKNDNTVYPIILLPNPEYADYYIDLFSKKYEELESSFYKKKNNFKSLLKELEMFGRENDIPVIYIKEKHIDMETIFHIEKIMSNYYSKSTTETILNDQFNSIIKRRMKNG